MHERPGVYSSYDASTVVSAGRAAKVIGVAAKAAQGTVGQPVTVTGYADGAAVFGQDETPGMSTILKLLFQNKHSFSPRRAGYKKAPPRQGAKPCSAVPPNFAANRRLCIPLTGDEAVSPTASSAKRLGSELRRAFRRRARSKCAAL